MMNMNSLEQGPERSKYLESKEGEPKLVDTKVILEFFRHGNKEKMNVPDEQVILSEKGRTQAMERGKGLHSRSAVALGLGSSRRRTQETAYRVMLENEGITSGMSLEEIEERIDKEMGGVGRKMIEDDRLNFDISGPVGPEGSKAYGEGKYLQWLVQRSDMDAKNSGDMISTVYMRQSANIAELCKRYLTIGNNFNRLAEKTDKYKEGGNQLERYLGTHQSVVETFIAKVLEKTKGESERDAFLSAVGESGFGEVGGSRIEIKNHGNEQILSFDYPVRDGESTVMRNIEFGGEVLDTIILERDQFDAEIKSNLAM